MCVRTLYCVSKVLAMVAKITNNKSLKRWYVLLISKVIDMEIKEFRNNR